MSTHSVLVNIVILMKHPSKEVPPWHITFQTAEKVYIVTPYPESTLHMGLIEVCACPAATLLTENLPCTYLIINLQDMPHFLEKLAQGIENSSPDACTLQSLITFSSTMGAMNEETQLYLFLSGFSNIHLQEWYSRDYVNDSVLQACMDECVPRRSKRLQAKQKAPSQTKGSNPQPMPNLWTSLTLVHGWIPSSPRSIPSAVATLHL